MCASARARRRQPRSGARSRNRARPGTDAPGPLSTRSPLVQAGRIPRLENARSTRARDHTGASALYAKVPANHSDDSDSLRTGQVASLESAPEALDECTCPPGGEATKARARSVAG